MAATAPTEPLIAGGSRRPCPVIDLPAGGTINLPNGQVITLSAPGTFQPICAPILPPLIANGGGGTIEETSTSNITSGDPPQYSDFYDPFYASTFPQCYALAATTVVAYTLVIMLFITPRSFVNGGVVVLGRKGFTNAGTGTSIGGRPWLQKVAALSVAISLTIATAATFRSAEAQYADGIQNAQTLQEDVLGGYELKIIRIISNTFLWLAQAQTLIRLFPRQREKVIIKWTAFALITLDVIFQSLNSFVYTNQGATRPRTFTDAVPALSYLFALALGVLYAAWVIYYSLMKKRYAFYHPQMKNMALVAALSLLAILVPVVFFILDISKPDFTGWGDYVRWVGAAAASVIVWEWVERIEALEREEKRDGILGREVFDGDEMLDMTPADEARARRLKSSHDDDRSSGSGSRPGGPGPEGNSTTGRTNLWPAVAAIRSRYRSQPRTKKTKRTEKTSDVVNTQPTTTDRIRFLQPPLWPARPAPAATPISRTDTASAASTVYAIRYHPLTETTSRTTPPPPPTENRAASRRDSAASSHHSHDESMSSGPEPTAPPAVPPVMPPTRSPAPPSEPASTGSRWRALTQTNPFRRPREDDEESAAPPPPTAPPNKPGKQEEGTSWDLRGRLEDFAMTQAEKLREKIRPTPDTDSLPVTVIPAPPRRGAALAQLLEEEELESHSRPHAGRRNSSASRTLAPGDESLPTSPISPTAQAFAAAAAAQRPPLSPVVAPRRRTPSVTIVAAPPRHDGGDGGDGGGGGVDGVQMLHPPPRP